MNKQELKAIADFVVAEAKRLGATDCEVTIASGKSVEVGIRVGTVEELQGAQTQGLDFRAFVGQRHASVSTSNLNRDVLSKVIADTIETAKIAQEDPTAGLADASAYSNDVPELGLFDDEASKLPVGKKIELAMAAEKAAMDADKRVVNSRGCGFSDETTVMVKANSRGLSVAYESSACSLSAAVIASDSEGDGVMQIGGWGSTSRKLSTLQSADEIGRIAAEHAIRQLNPRRVKSQTCPVIYDPQSAAGLISKLIGAASGAQIYRKSSFLVDKRGTEIASKLVTIVDDPHIIGGLASRPIDSEGLPTRKRVIVDKGTLECYLLGIYSARKLGEAPNGGSISNLYLENGETSVEDMIASVENGLYLTSASGLGFNATTGDYSVGASGIWIENGKFAFPVQGITVAGHIIGMLKGIGAVGNDLVFRSSVNSPTIMIDKMMLAGE